MRFNFLLIFNFFLVGRVAEETRQRTSHSRSQPSGPAGQVSRGGHGRAAGRVRPHPRRF